MTKSPRQPLKCQPNNWTSLPLKIRHPFHSKSLLLLEIKWKNQYKWQQYPQRAIDQGRIKRNVLIDDGILTGPGWGRYFVGPLQFVICYGAVIVCSLLGGQSLKVSLLCLPAFLLFFFFSLFNVWEIQRKGKQEYDSPFFIGSRYTILTKLDCSQIFYSINSPLNLKLSRVWPQRKWTAESSLSTLTLKIFSIFSFYIKHELTEKVLHFQANWCLYHGGKNPRKISI